MVERPSWDEYFVSISEAVAARGTCDRGRSGCVIVRDKRLLTTGYVGSPPGMPHCDDVGHLMKSVTHEDGTTSRHCLRTTHAEMNAILQAARYGINIEGATLYCKLVPCPNCAKAIIGSGILRVVCQKDYHGAKETRGMFTQAGVELVVLDETVEEYPDQ